MPYSKLLSGFRSFQAEYFKKNSNLYKDLVNQGQQPETLVIACSDSRNDPALLTKSEPGDIFVIRNVAAIVPPYQPDDHYHGTSAAIEFAVKGLKVKNIIVLGHALCGGVEALASPDKKASAYEFLSGWIAIGESARDAVESQLSDAPDDVRQRAMEQALILTSLNNLMTFPWIREQVDAGNLTLHGWYFDMPNGALLEYDAAAGQFREIHDSAKKETVKKHGHSGCCDEWPLEKMLKNHC